MQITQAFHVGMLDHRPTLMGRRPSHKKSEAKIGLLPQDKHAEIRVDGKRQTRGLRIARILGWLRFIALDGHGGAHTQLRRDLLS